MKKKLIYIAGPYKAKKHYQSFDHVMEMRWWAILVWQSGGVPIAPLLNTFGMDDVLSREEFIAGDLEIVRRCDALLLTGAWSYSDGCLQEKRAAELAGVPVFTSMAQVRDFIKGD